MRLMPTTSVAAYHGWPGRNVAADPQASENAAGLQQRLRFEMGSH